MSPSDPQAPQTPPHEGGGDEGLLVASLSREYPSSLSMRSRYSCQVENTRESEARERAGSVGAKRREGSWPASRSPRRPACHLLGPDPWYDRCRSCGHERPHCLSVWSRGGGKRCCADLQRFSGRQVATNFAETEETPNMPTASVPVLPRPFLHYPGGKRGLLKKLRKCYPDLGQIRKYVEPFVGGGAVLIDLLKLKPDLHAVVADIDPDIVCLYEVVRDRPRQLISQFNQHLRLHGERYYYELRDGDVPRGRVKRAARAIYLNRAGYNGMWRKNRKGQFNMPSGKRRTKKISFNPEAVIVAGRALRKVQILEQPFEQTCEGIGKGTFVFLDPPHYPRSRTSGFRDYSGVPFGPEDHERLALIFSELVDRDAYVILSNSWTTPVRELYSSFTTKRVRMPRSINCKGTKRGPVYEILVISPNLSKV